MHNMYGLKPRDDSIILSINRDVTTIGRHTSNDIVINAPPVSRHHSCIVKIDGRYFIKDRNTANGTFIQKHKLLPDRETLLKIGDSIGIGTKAGEDSKCTFEVVFIQFDSTNQMSPSEEIPSVVDSSTDSNQTPTQIYSEKKSEITPSTSKQLASITEKNRISDKKENGVVKSSENKDNSKTLIAPSEEAPKSNNTLFNCETKMELIDSSTDDVVLHDIKSDPEVIIDLCRDDIPIDLCCDDDEELGAVLQEEIITEAEILEFKPLFTSAKYTTLLDPITILDSDEEDFPCSQLNVSSTEDLEDFSVPFRAMYSEYDLDSPESPSDLHCTDDTWYESDGKELNIDLPMIQAKSKKEKRKNEISSDSIEDQIVVDLKSRKRHSSEELVRENDTSPKSTSGLHCTDDTWHKSGGKELNADLPTIRTKSKKKKRKRKHKILNHIGDQTVADKKTRKGHSLEELVRENDAKQPFTEDETDNILPPKPHKRKRSSDNISKHVSAKIMKREESFCQTTIPDRTLGTRQLRVVVPDFMKDEPLPESVKNESIGVTDDEDVFRLDHTKKMKRKPGPRCRTMMQKSSSRSKDKEAVVKGPVKTLDKRELKEFRKEKLRQITLKNESLPNMKVESSHRVVVAKCTKQNRSDKMYMGSNSNCVSDYAELECAPEYEERRRESHGVDSFYDDVLGLSSQTPDEPSQSILTEDVQASLKGENKSSMVIEEFDSSSKRIARTHRRLESTDKDKSPSLSPTNREEMLSTKVSSGKEEQSLCTSTTYPIKKVVPSSNVAEGKLRSAMKKPGFGFYNDTKKRVHFNSFNPERRFIDIDPEERGNGVYTFKIKKDNLMKEKLFDSTVAQACNWKVDWLKEQQELAEPPPYIYVRSNASLEGSPQFNKLFEYKENLKEKMFHHLWNAVSHQSHNQPNQDYLPNTQSVTDGRKGIYILRMDNVIDINRKAQPLRLMTAYRNVDQNFVGDELTSGQMVILSLRLKQPGKVTKFSRGNIFAYVASTLIVGRDGVKQQRVVFKTYPRNCEINMDEIKVKVLPCTKFLLKRFESFAMVDKSPLTDLLVSEGSEPIPLSKIHQEQDFVDNAYLDRSQRSAIITCLNSISSPEPSVCLVDGLPGTGKSQVIVSLMNEIFSEARYQLLPAKLKVLIITKTDKLADDLVHRLVKRDNVTDPWSMNVLRYGRSKLNTKVRHCNIGDQIRGLIEEGAGNSLIDLEQEKSIVLAMKNSLELVMNSEHLTEEKRVSNQWKLTTLENHYADLSNDNPNKTKDQLLQRAAKNRVLEKANVIVTSTHECWSSRSLFENDFVLSDYTRGDDVPKLTVCIIDDANYTDEVQMLVPIVLMVPKLILVGDSRNEIYHERQGLPLSPFSRLVEDFKKRKLDAIVSLQFQHRIHHTVCAFRWLSVGHSLPLQVKPKTSRIISFLMVHLQMNNCVNLTNQDKWAKQADFCYRLLLRINELESDTQIAIIVVTQEEKYILDKMIAYYVKERLKIHVCSWDEAIGRDYEVVIACFSTKPHPIEKWLYTVCSRARSHLFICGYLEDDWIKNNQNLQSLKARAELKKMCVKLNVDDDLPNEYLLDSR